MVYGHTGGVGGGSVYVYSRHVDIDGHITVNGENPGTALGADAGLSNISKNSFCWYFWK